MDCTVVIAYEPTVHEQSNVRKQRHGGFCSAKASGWIDFVVMGHNHISSRQIIGNGVYINLGDWIFENTYAVYDGKKIELKKYID